MASSAPVHGNWIAGKWVPARSGRTFENRNPADVTDLIGRFADSDERDAKDAVDVAAEAYRTLAPRAGPAARRDPVPPRRDPARPQGAVRARHDARDGQGPQGGPRRRPGGHRHGLPHGRRGPAPARADDAVRAAEQVRDVGAVADRRLRVHHAVELPDGDPGLEDDGRPRVRQHGRHQAGDGHAALGRELRARARGRGPPARRLQRRHGQRLEGRACRSSRTRA